MTYPRTKSEGVDAIQKLRMFKMGREILLEVYDLSLANITPGGGRRRKCIRGKRAIVNFCRRELEMTEMEVSAATGLDRTTVNYHFHKHDEIMKKDKEYEYLYKFFIETFRLRWVDHVLTI